MSIRMMIQTLALNTSVYEIDRNEIIEEILNLVHQKVINIDKRRVR